jgi:hypothetical protein
MAEIRRANRQLGHYFFSPETMRFFRSRVGREVIGGRYFVTSEQFDEVSPRLYTVRRANDDGSIDTASEFQGFTTGREARACAELLALVEVQS